MKHTPSIRHIRRTLLSAVSLLCVLLLVLPAAGLLSSCVDDAFNPSASPDPAPADNTDMYLSVSVPRTFSGSGTDADKENRIETLDVLVFRNGVGNAAGSYFVHAACKGELTAGGRTFQVAMPIGEHFNIHVFANCHDALVAKGFYNSRGKEMNTLLRALTTGVNINNGNISAMPMHGYISDVTISKADAGHSLTVPVLRSVSSVQVMTNLTQGGTPSNPTLTPGEVTDADGNRNFELRELYVYFYPDSGCIAPATTSYESLPAGAADETRNVQAVSLPQAHKVSDTRQDADDYPDHPRPYSLISPTAVSSLGSLYFYENKPCSDTGFDQPDETTPVATTRLVVGGVYGTDKNSDGTPKVTYYRVDFTGTNGKLTEILRNHRYVFNIKTVGGSGYDTPDDAALGVPVNIYIEVLDWVSEVEYTDFDMQNYFYSETKSVRLSRNANSVQSIAVESDVEAFRWEMSFATENNGASVLSSDGNTLVNSRYRVEKAFDGKSLTFTALKAYDDVASSETPAETLILKVRNLNITYRITQEDGSPDDWGNGGESETDLGRVIDLGDGFDFYFAPGNLHAIKNTAGECEYLFALEQQQSSNDVKNGGYCFNKNKLNPFWDEVASGGDGDACAKMGKGWYTPSSGQLQQMLNAGYVGGTMKGVSGYYYGTTTVPPDTEDPYRYVFLPTANSRRYNGNSTSYALYGISDGTIAAGLLTNNNNSMTVSGYWQVSKQNIEGRHLRCVKNKK